MRFADNILVLKPQYDDLIGKYLILIILTDEFGASKTYKIEVEVIEKRFNIQKSNLNRTYQNNKWNSSEFRI
jgi:hypothetical protein